MAHHHDRLEPLADGFIAFHTAKGERWKHRDETPSRTGPGYRLFVSDRGERRRYTFGPGEPHDATVLDLRDQLARSTPEDAATTTTTTTASTASAAMPDEGRPGAT